jgi:hypothetical protein
MQSRCQLVSDLILALAVATALVSTCPAQEVAFLDLTKVAARVDLRRPKASSPRAGGYNGIDATYPCSDPTHNMGALRASLVSLDRTHYQVEDEPTFEATVENVGSTPLGIPFSPHLADLQPKNPAQKFAYSELRIELWIAAGSRWSTNSGGVVALYGSPEHASTMLTLNPGEWVRVIGRGHLRLDENIKPLLSDHPADQVYAQASIYRDETLITPTQSANTSHEACLAQTQGQSIPIELTIP